MSKSITRDQTCWTIIVRFLLIQNCFLFYEMTPNHSALPTAHFILFMFQRIKLFNAYVMEKMCQASIPVLDVYQISASYPQGTIDGIHYPHFVFYPAEEALERYFTT